MGAHPTANPPEPADPTRWRWVALALFPGHVLFTALFLDLRGEHVVLNGAMLALAWVGPRSRRAGLLLLPFWLVGVVYDASKLLAAFKGAIHVGDVYALELSLFPVAGPDGTITPAEYFATHNGPVADLATGFAYMVYVLEPPLLALLLALRKHRRRAAWLGWGFLLVNVAGLATQVVWPVAPPWYVMDHGLGPAILDAAPSAAGAARFDALTGLGYFAAFYSRNANIFGAMPSLHAAYPVLCLAVVAPLGGRWSVPAALFAALVAFAAVYLQHHYVIDVVAGVTYAVATYALLHAVRRAARAFHPPAVAPAPSRS